MMRPTLGTGDCFVRSFLAAVALVASALAATQSAGQHSTPLVVAQQQDSVPLAEPKVTFNKDVAPIVFRNCAACHRPGEAGPFPLLTYADVKKHARQIVAVTRSRFMPPWLPAPGELEFAGEMRLSDHELALIQQWVDQGTLEGNPADLPAQPQFVPGWQLGKPDLIVQAQKPFELLASGTDTYWNFILPIPVQRTRWVKAVEIRPGDKRLVHHANILVDRMRSARAKEKEPGDGFGGMDLRIESEAFDPDSHFLFWKPGTVPSEEPEGMALRIDPGNDLVLNAHLQPSGKPESIQPSVGLYFTDKPATLYPMLLEMENDAALKIPPGVGDFLVSDDFKLPIDVDLLAIYPHAHYLGRDLQATATLPGGEKKNLIRIERWNLNWQAVYRYAEPVFLPKGTTVSMRYVYDNSENNLANPNHPPKQVNGGNRSSDEMAHLWLQVLPRNFSASAGDPRLRLQEAFSLHQVEKNPANFEAQYNLAAMLQARGKVAESLPHYEAAARLRPGDPVVNNSLGSALMALGQVSDAVDRFREAARARPDYFDPHYNLGAALASQGDYRGAEEQFREAVRLNPEDAGAQANLGAALAQLGRLAEAKTCFEHALKLEPGNELARENLEEVERNLGQRPQ
jgi:Flp pilus assembly protein TadD/mono/diheme cytochrome c family protein